MQGSEAQAATQAGSARIKSGVYHQTGAFVGMTVSQVRERFGSRWKIADDAKALKGKEELAEDYVIQANDEVTFLKVQGEKGI